MTENLKPVNRSNKHLKYKHLYPNNTLSSEYNITEQIYLTNTTYKNDALIQYVYRYKDTNSRGAMTMEAKLNAVADELAEQYQTKLGSYVPITHMYQSVPTVLELNSMTITSNIQHHLIKTYT